MSTFSETYMDEIFNHRRNILNEFPWMETEEVDDALNKVLEATTPMQEVGAFAQPMTKLRPLFDNFDFDQSLVYAMRLLLVNAGEGFYKVYPYTHYENQTGTLGIKTCLSMEDVEREMYPPPSLKVPGVPNDDGLVLKKCSYAAPHQDKECIDYLQSIPLYLNKSILKVEELPKDKLEPLPQRVFDEFVQQSNALYEEYEDKDFYMQWKYDARGRMYSQGYHINPQGSSYKKACIQLSDEYYLD